MKKLEGTDIGRHFEKLGFDVYFLASWVEKSSERIICGVYDWRTGLLFFSRQYNFFYVA